MIEAEGEVGIPSNRFKPPQYFYIDRSKVVLLLWFLTVTCSGCPYLYFGSAIMLVLDELRFYVPSTVFQSFRDDGRVNMKGSVQ